ncbi:cell division protein FtsK [Longispora sp. NPDC051575]|uniref:cell division protein FtsK n=1 Tax=Longispora sp. NPDC051575 TaxID=3154943 RepID=UPI003412BC89
MASNSEEFDFDRHAEEIGVNADVLDLDAARASRTRPAPGPDDIAGTHFDVPLDDEPTPGGGAVAVPVLAGGRRQVIPSALASWANIRSTVRHAAGLAGHIVAFHAVRTPWYLAQAGFWASVGLFRLAGRQLRWWWLTEQHGLRQAAAAGNEPDVWLKLQKEGKRTRLWRFCVLAAEAMGIAIGGPVAYALAPGWAVGLAVAGAVGYLAHVGRPADRPILSTAVVAGRFRRINPDIVLRAYYSAGLGHPDRAGQKVDFGSTMARDNSNTGSQVSVDLPYGKTFDDALKARGSIASGLDVSINQVFITKDKSSHRRHTLFVADRDPLAIPAGRTPLLDCKPRDIWAPAPFGLDERGRKVDLLLMWISVLVGAQPRKGKTFSARLLALYAALDPWVKLVLVDGKNSPDWDKFRLVAHRTVFGVHPNARDTDPITHLLEALREVKKHIEAVNEVLSTLPPSLCPEGKLTRELARSPKYPDLRVWLLIMEEFQVYYETDDQNVNKEIASLLSYIIGVGPSAGVVILSSSQKPSGVGAGDVQRLFNRYRDNHAARFALKTGNRIVSEAVLGGDAYAEGFDASSLPTGKEYLGVGYLYGLTDDTPTVRTFLADHGDAEKILTAARKHREAAGTLSGAAAGETIVRDVRDVLADTRSVFAAGEAGLHWPTIAARLAEQIPEHYADTTAESISAQLRALGLQSVDIKAGGTVLKGARLAGIVTAIQSRDAA